MSKRNGITDIFTIDMDHAAVVYGDANITEGPKSYNNISRAGANGYYDGMKKHMFELELEIWNGSKLYEAVSYYMDSYGEMHERLKKLDLAPKSYAQFMDWLHNTKDVLTLDTEEYKRYTFETSLYNYNLFLNRSLSNETSDDTILPRGVMNK